MLLYILHGYLSEFCLVYFVPEIFHPTFLLLYKLVLLSIWTSTAAAGPLGLTATSKQGVYLEK